MNLNPEQIKLVAYAVGFVYSIFVGLLIGCTQKSLYEEFKDRKIPEWRSKVTGLVERGLYTATSLVGHPEFVGFWLAVKSLARWDMFKADTRTKASKKDARSIFNAYFVGTGLSIAYGFNGAYISKKLINHQILSAFILAFGLVVAHITLNIYIKSKVEKEKKG